jgi:uncharacterized protein
MNMSFALAAGGTAAGFLAGMFGIGGGALVIPILIYIYRDAGLDATEGIRLAFGTSLATMAFTGLSSYLSHRRRQNVDTPWLRKLFWPSGVGATCGAVLASHIPGVWLALGLSAMLAWFGVKLLFRHERASTQSALLLRFHPMAGFFSGLAYALAGMGGASVITFYLTHVGLPLRRAIGTATGVILPISVGAIIGFGVTAGWPHGWRWGYIDLHALLVMSLCSIVAARLGVKAAGALPTHQLRKAFGLFMMALAVRTVVTVFTG